MEVFKTLISIHLRGKIKVNRGKLVEPKTSSYDKF